jgi:elongator complex protein 4
MSFRKRNVALSSTADTPSKTSQSPVKAQLPGVKPSSIDGRPVTSTGTATLDGLLAGHGGLALGCSLLIEENGTTDYAGALLKFYAAEGILQGHHVHVLGLPEQWGRELPGAVSESEKDKSGVKNEKMKIAWRYESLGQFGASSVGSRGGCPCTLMQSSRKMILLNARCCPVPGSDNR